MSAAKTTEDQQSVLFVSNRWINTIYSGYGVVKQRILLEILRILKKDILLVMNGAKVVNFKIPADGKVIELDMSIIVHYNNYKQVRDALEEMCMIPVSIYNDPSFKKPLYFSAPLLNAWKAGKKKSIVKIRITKIIAELLLHVNYGPNKKTGKYGPSQYTSFDTKALRTRSGKYGMSCKYMFPLYTMICSWAQEGGFTMDIDTLRERLQVEEKYKGFDNFHRYVLKHVQEELKMCGDYCFNFDLKKKGKEVKTVVFKIFPNKEKNPNAAWMKIYEALNEKLPYFAQFTEQQRAEFNYLLTSKYDLDQVYGKLLHIHKALVRHREQLDPIRKTFDYTIKAIREQFPPG